MPILKINHVVSFSSEDKTHVAQNILSTDSSKKWKCATSGEKSAMVVLQLEKATVISGIDIGNEHSAYIEVLVSRSGTNNEFKVLLVMSSFMTPVESRQSTNVNKVRMFNNEQLSKPVCNEKWDLIKVVCTQPFNKHVQYGLSFITFHTPEVKDSSSEASNLLGKFTLRSPSPDNLAPGSLFARRKQLKENEEPISAAVAIRQASEVKNASPLNKQKAKLTVTPNKPKSPCTSFNSAVPARNRNELLYNEDEEKANAKIDKIIEKKNNEIRAKQQKEDESKEKQAKKNNNSTDSKNKKDAKMPKKRVDEPSTSDSPKRKLDVENKPSKKVKLNRRTKPFDQMMSDVVFVISGIQNPTRADLRTAALSMGAKYKGDWDNTCTHLVCAFPNTPKFSQVKGKGKIVTRKWIEDCVSERKRLPWRRYALDRSDQGKEESEEEIWEKTEDEVNIPQQSGSNDYVSDEPEKDDASDTEMEIARIQNQEVKANKSDDPFEADTDEERIETVNIDFTNTLPTFFANKIFFVDKCLEKSDFDLLKRYIIAYKGSIVDSPDDVDIIITKKPNVYKNAPCVSSYWVWACHNAQNLLPTERYVLS